MFSLPVPERPTERLPLLFHTDPAPSTAGETPQSVEDAALPAGKTPQPSEDPTQQTAEAAPGVDGQPSDPETGPAAAGDRAQPAQDETQNPQN